MKTAKETWLTWVSRAEEALTEQEQKEILQILKGLRYVRGKNVKKLSDVYPAIRREYGLD